MPDNSARVYEIKQNVLAFCSVYLFNDNRTATQKFWNFEMVVAGLSQSSGTLILGCCSSVT